MEEDEELAGIRRRKLREMLKRDTSHKTNDIQGQKKMALDKPIEITDSTFKDIVEKNPLVVVDCWASWCAPCRMIAPVIEELARDYAGRILFGKLNVDENGRTATQYQVMSIPTLLVFKNRNLVDRIVGALPRKLLEPKITCHL